MPRGSTFKYATPQEAIEARVVVDENGCWKWSGLKVQPDGYVLLGWRYKLVRVHRFVYENLVGEIPEGHQIDHLCRVRWCCNPDHLEAVTPRENTMRGLGPAAKNATVTHCPYGHEYAGENLVVRPGGRRGCRECMRRRTRDYMRRYRAEQKEMTAK